MARNRHADSTIMQNVRMRRRYGQIAKKVEKELMDLRRSVRLQLDEAFKGRDAAQVAVMRKALRDVDAMVNNQYKAIEELLSDELSELYQAELDFSAKTLGAATTASVTAAQIRSIVMNDAFDGKILKEWISEQTLATQNRIKQTIRTGIANGVPHREIGKELLASNAFKGSLANASVMIRTAGNHFVSQADIKAFSETGFEKYQLSAVLDTRTTEICASLDGEVFDVNDPLKKVPPFHPGCRTIMIPFEGDDKPIKENYEQWLAKQSEERQIEVLGPTRHKMWLSGQSLGSFVDSESLTLKPL